MAIMQLVTCMTLLFYLLFILIAESAARPFNGMDTFISTPLGIDRSFHDVFKYPARAVALKGSLLSRLKRGYYYIDEGQITPVHPVILNPNAQADTAHRRQDYFASEKSEYYKPKKLFVPNLFG